MCGGTCLKVFFNNNQGSVRNDTYIPSLSYQKNNNQEPVRLEAANRSGSLYERNMYQKTSEPIGNEFGSDHNLLNLNNKLEPNSQIYPQQQDMLVYPQQQNIEAYPQQQNMEAYPQQQNMVAYPQQQNMVAYPQQQNMLVDPQQQNMLVDPPQQDLLNEGLLKEDIEQNHDPK